MLQIYQKDYKIVFVMIYNKIGWNLKPAEQRAFLGKQIARVKDETG